MPPAGPPRSFALTGPSPAIDRNTQAVRPDLADVRLADIVFAPHYAAPMIMQLVKAAPLMPSASRIDPPVVTLMAGDVFEMLDVSAGLAWGIALRPGLVGYVDRAALDVVGGAT